MIYYWDTCGSPVIKRLCFFVVFLFSSTTRWKNCTTVPTGHRALNAMTTNCDPMRVKVFTCWARVLSWWWLTLSCTNRAGLHDEPGDFCSYNSFFSYFLFVLGLLFWRWRCNGFGLRLPGALWCKRSKYLDEYTSRIIRGQSTLKDVIERYFWNVLSRERLKAMKALYALKAIKALYALYAKYAKCAKYANVLVEKRTLVEKGKIWNLKSNCIYSMQSIEQHYYHETEEQNSNGCKLLVKLATNTGMAPTFNRMIKIVKVNKLYLSSLLVSIVNRVSRSGTIKYQCEWKHRCVKQEMVTYVAKGWQPFLFSEVVQLYPNDEKVICWLALLTKLI